jgi:hypothetical protein
MRILGVSASRILPSLGAYELIESAILTSNQSSVTFSNLNSFSTEYKHLQIRMTARLSSSTSIRLSILRINGVTENRTYNYGYLRGQNSVITASPNGNSSIYTGYVPAADQPANAFSSSIIDLLDVYSTTKSTTLKALEGIGTQDGFIQLTSGVFYSTNSVDSIEITAITGSQFVSGSRFSLYGIRG